MIPKIITKDQIYGNFPAYATILKTSVFICPTDTIYGLSCDARNKELVKKIKKIKGSNQAFSVIAPSKEWIIENCDVTGVLAEEWISKLPGPYTLIFELKNKNIVSDEVYNKNNNTIGIRIPNHWISQLASRLNTPLITTSANKTGGDFMTSIEDIDDDLKKEVNLIIYEGELKRHPSTIVHLYNEEKIVER